MTTAEGAWEPHAEMLAMTANINRDTKKRARPFNGKEFNPFTPASSRAPAKRGMPITAGSIFMLKSLLPKKKGGPK